MTTVTYISIALLLVTAIFLGIRYFVRVCLRYGGAQRIVCPETGKAAMVEVDILRAGLTSAVGQPDIRLKSCWRWPLNENCGQECLTQLDGPPANCLVRGVLSKWYHSKFCVYCGKQFNEIALTDHKPAVETADGSLLEWEQVTINDFQKALSTFVPVCWDCYIAQSFRRDHPELVVYRPWQNDIHAGAHLRH